MTTMLEFEKKIDGMKYLIETSQHEDTVQECKYRFAGMSEMLDAVEDEIEKMHRENCARLGIDDANDWLEAETLSVNSIKEKLAKMREEIKG